MLTMHENKKNSGGWKGKLMDGWVSGRVSGCAGGWMGSRFGLSDDTALSEN